MSGGRVNLLAAVLDATALSAAIVLAVVLSTGGFELRWHGYVVRATDVLRPAAFLIVTLGVRAWLLRLHSPRHWVATGIERAAVGGLLTVAAASCLTYAYYRVRVCGGLDSQGYVTTSRLLASGRLIEDQPLVPLLPFENAAEAATPLGYVVAPDGHSRAPRFPLGLPLVMAAFRAVGAEGPFLVPLTCGIGLLIVVFAMAREAGSAITGLFAAALVAVSPTVASGMVQPMSDVPAAFWLTLAAWLAFRESPRFVASGLSAGMAFLTRPALLPAVLTIALLALLQSRDAWRSLVVIALFIALQSVINAVLYGGSIGVGYGPPSELFQLSRLRTNVVNIVKWTTVTHTRLIWPAWIAALVALRRFRQPLFLSVVALASVFPYLFYLTYDDWESTRFIVGGLVLVLVVIAQGVDALAMKTFNESGRVLLIGGLAVACAVASARFLHGTYLFDLWRADQKYALAGEWLEENTPPQAVILSSLHSGSIRYYGSRDTVRWDRVPAGSLRSAVDSLQMHGHPVYLALDVPTEADPFNARFRTDLSQVLLLPAGGVREVIFYELKSSTAPHH